MDGSGHELFAHAAFASDQQGRAGVGDLIDDLLDGLHGRGGAEERRILWERAVGIHELHETLKLLVPEAVETQSHAIRIHSFHVRDKGQRILIGQGKPYLDASLSRGSEGKRSRWHGWTN